MENHVFLFSTLWVFGLLGMATLVKALTSRIKIPFAVGLLATGLGLSWVQNFYGFDGGLEFSPDLVFYVFLPTLIFESAYHMNFRHFRSVLPEALVLATFGLGISVAVTATLMHFVLGLPWGASALFGALISATDPVAVLAIFRELRVPKKLATIVDGESLLNDGTALVVFQILFKVVVLGGAMHLGAGSLLRQGIGAAEVIIFGVLVGVSLGWIFSLAIPRMQSRGARLTLSLILAHVTFLIAEGVLGVSGILATMSAGIVMGNFGRRKLSRKTQESFSEIWKFLEFVSNSLVFLLLGLRLGSFDFLAHAEWIAVAVVATIVVARPLSVFPSFAVANLFRRKEDRSPFSHQVVTAWGGLRGALAAAAVLLIPDTFQWVNEFQAMTTGVILATFLFKATTIPFWLKKFGLIQLSKSERVQKLEAKVLINERVGEHLQKMRDRKYISGEVHDSLHDRYRMQQERSELELEVMQNSLMSNAREVEKTLSHFALGIEKKTYRRLFELGELSEGRLTVLQGSILRQIDRLEKDILPEERGIDASCAPQIPDKKCPLTQRIFVRFWRWRRHRQIAMRWQHYRARRIASWRVVLDFESLQQTHPLFQRSEVVERMLKRYRGWNGNSEKKMKHIENQHPEVIDPLKLQIAEASCLKRETELESEFLEKGLISEKVFENLDEDVRRRRGQCHVRDVPQLFR